MKQIEKDVRRVAEELVANIGVEQDEERTTVRVYLLNDSIWHCHGLSVLTVKFPSGDLKAEKAAWEFLRDAMDMGTDDDKEYSAAAYSEHGSAVTTNFDLEGMPVCE